MFDNKNVPKHSMYRSKRQTEGETAEVFDDRPKNPSLRKYIPEGYDKYVVPGNLNGGKYLEKIL